MIGVTGATGTVGREVIRLLEGQGIPYCALVRNLEKAHTLGYSADKCVHFNFSEQNTHTNALKGLKRLVLIASRGSQHLEQFLEEARDQGIEQVVVLSGIGAWENKAEAPLAQVEACVHQADVPYTCLRLNWFMQNFNNYFHVDIQEQGIIALPAGDAQTSFVDVRDIAAVIVKVLESHKHLGKTYVVTGEEALTYTDVAYHLAIALDRPITYHPLTEEEGRQKFLDAGWGEDSTNEMIRLFRQIRNGLTAPISPSVKELLGREPIRFAQYANDYKRSWG